MRITAIIISIFISFLAVKPGVDVVCSMLTDIEINCCDTTCSRPSDDDITKNQEQDNSCNGKRCNPFQVCNSCVLLISDKATIDDLSKPITPLKARFTYQSVIISQYISDFWQPPKFV